MRWRRFHHSFRSASVGDSRIARARIRFCGWMLRSRSAHTRSLPADRFSVIALRPDPHPQPLPTRGRGLEGFVAAVAHRFFAGALAGAEPGLFGLRRLVFDRRESRALVRAVAERLRFRAPAGAPPIALAGLELDRERPPAADFRHFAHLVFSAPLISFSP